VNRLLSIILASTFALTAASLHTAAQGNSQPSPGKSNPKSAQVASADSDEGEMRFRANCGRCHNPPESLSPREVRAVVRQMRTRAMLNAEDERLILQYLSP
jgi:cytochrome c5